MDAIERWRGLFVHEDWANRAFLSSLRAADGAPPETVRLLAHLVGTGLLWLARLENRSTQVPVWPEYGLDEIESGLDQLKMAWPLYLSTIDGARTSDEITYTNSKGEPWKSSIESIKESQDEAHTMMVRLARQSIHGQDIKYIIDDLSRSVNPARQDTIVAVKRALRAVRAEKIPARKELIDWLDQDAGACRRVGGTSGSYLCHEDIRASLDQCLDRTLSREIVGTRASGQVDVI